MSYAPGTPIPLLLTFTGQDAQVLDLLSVPSAIRLHLVRSIATGSDATYNDVMGRRSDNFSQATISQAYFWPGFQSVAQEKERVLQGELELPDPVTPSFRFPGFTLEVSVLIGCLCDVLRVCGQYTLDLQLFEVPGFVQATTARHRK